MLWSWLAELCLSLFTDLFMRLPTDVNNVSQWLSDPSVAVDDIVSKIAPLGSILPLGLMVTLLWVSVCIVLPVAMGVMFAQFLLDHMPTIAGFGVK